MDSDAGGERILAAGGLVLQSAGELAPTMKADRVLVIHRSRYGGDWSLPKGKSRAGETLEETALREVLEETGLGCRIVRPISEIRYEYKAGRGGTKSKSVYYFLMEVVTGTIQTDGDEVDHVEWLDAGRAMETLTYEGDKRVLGEFFGADPERRWNGGKTTHNNAHD